MNEDKINEHQRHKHDRPQKIVYELGNLMKERQLNSRAILFRPECLHLAQNLIPAIIPRPRN